MTARTFEHYEKEYSFLELTAKALTCRGYEEGKTFRVEDTYLDFGQDWKWTTIICYSDDGVFGHYQALSPRDWHEIVESTTTEELLKAVAMVVRRVFEEA